MKEQSNSSAATKQYMAFISYSHADNREEGRKWADWLHTSLETYEIPEELIGGKNSRDEEIPRQIYPVFQDEKELSANASLSDSLKGSLDRTENLILLCSPKSAKSIYVQDEVRYFKQIGRSKNIIALILSGEPQPEEKQTEIQCFPKALRFSVNSDGEILMDQPEEPIAADVRTEDAGEGFTTPEAYRRSLLNKNLGKAEINSKVNAYKDKLDNARLKIISGILKVPLGELTKRDKAYELKKMKARNRNIKRVATAIGVLGVVAIIMGVLAWRQKNKAEDTLARSLYQTGVNRIEAEDISGGAAYIAAAARMGDDNAVMYAQSLLTNQNTEVKLPNIQYQNGIEYSPSGKYIAYVADNGINKGMVSVWDAVSLKPLNTLQSVKFMNFSKPQFDDSEKLVYGINESGNMFRWDFINNKTDLLTKFDSTVAIGTFILSPNGEMAYLGFPDKTYSFYNIPAKSVVSKPLSLIGAGMSFNKAAFNKSGNYVVEYALNSNVVRLSKIDSGRVVTTENIGIDTIVSSVKFNAGGSQLALYNLNSLYIVHLNGAHTPVKMNLTGGIQDVYFNDDNSVAARGTFDYSLFNSANGSLIKKISGDRFLDGVFRSSSYTSPDKTQILKSTDDNVFLQNVLNTPMLKSQLLVDTNFIKAVVSFDGTSVYVLKKGALSVEKWNSVTGEQKPSVFKTKQKIVSFRRVVKPNIVYTISQSDTSSKLMTLTFWDEKTEKQIGRDVLVKKQSYNMFVTEDGKRFAARIDDRTLGIFSVESGKTEHQFQSRQPIKNYLIAQDLKHAIILAPDKNWQVVDLEKNKVLKNEKASFLSAMAGAFANNGKYVAMRMSDGTVNVWNIADMDLRFKFSSQSTSDGVLKFSPDGETLAASDDVNNIKLWNVGDKTTFGQVIKTNSSIRNFDWSPDGKRIFTVLSNSPGENIHVFDAENGYPASKGFGSGSVFDSEFFDDGKAVMTVSSTTNNMILNFWEMPGLIKISNKDLASDLEQLFGKQYNFSTGALETFKSTGINNSCWYFKDPYVRESTPGAQLTVLETIKAHAPVKGESDINFLTAISGHPLARVAVAEYYARDPGTKFIADHLLQITKFQLPRIRDGKLKAEVTQIMNNTEQQLKK